MQANAVARRVQRRVFNSLKLELQVIVSLQIRVLGIKVRLSAKVYVHLSTEPTLCLTPLFFIIPHARDTEACHSHGLLIFTLAVNWKTSLSSVLQIR